MTVIGKSAQERALEAQADLYGLLSRPVPNDWGERAKARSEFVETLRSVLSTAELAIIPANQHRAFRGFADTQKARFQTIVNAAWAAYVQAAGPRAAIEQIRGRIADVKFELASCDVIEQALATRSVAA